MFAACSTDDGDDNDGGTSLGSLPSLPTDDDPNLAYITSEAEAKALLTALKPAFGSVGNQVQSLIEHAQDDSSDEGNWNISGNTFIDGLKVTSKGSNTYKATPPNFMNEGYTNPKVGDNVQMSSSMETAVDITKDKTESGVVIYQGSKVEQKEKESGSYSITAVSLSPLNIKIRISGSGEESAVYTLTVSSGGKGGKIILDARQSGSLSTDYIYTGDDDDDFPDMALKYSGSLTVYGADDAVIYSLPINNEATYETATAYFD
jgi:hypothetical protein